MSRLRKYGRIAFVVVAVLVAAQGSVSLLVRTRRVHGYLVAHLESAFGRPVEVGGLSVTVLPIPELDVAAITIGENPAFGHEYFLRAEHMTAQFRWLGLLRGHFEFGTMSLTRPSLILVRNRAGRWNLEDWLPPAGPATAGSRPGAGGQTAVESTHHLREIDFDDGRINFKDGEEKRPFAFIEVSGSVEQVSEGRWQLRLEAQPWRSGVSLQSTGTVQVVGDVAGTSARLQPAELRLHWGKVSLADLFRLATGNDSGVRGEFSLDGSASVGRDAASANPSPRAWRFALEARATEIHRWDLTERGDNPRMNVNVKGLWDIAKAEARAEELRVELPRSNLVGSAVVETADPANWQGRFKSMAVEGTDLLAWYRAFHPDVAEEVTLDERITGQVSAGGWPLRWEDGTVQGSAGTLRVPGTSLARIDPFHARVRDGKFDLEGLRLKWGAAPTPQAANEKGATKPRTVAAPENMVEVLLDLDSGGQGGALRLNLHLADTTPVFKTTAAFGYPLNKGWEYTGTASGSFAWNWQTTWQEAHRTGSIELTKSQLQVAGLNEPVRVEQARLEWKDGVESATLGKVEAFGAAWSGNISEPFDGTASDESHWGFALHADRLDAKELDRWIGPRARPNWLQRLLPSLLGGTETAGRASELLRRVSATGELSADAITIEKIKLVKARARLSLHALHLEATDAEAQWAGGAVRGGMQAVFSPLPKYEVNAELDRVNLAQLPWPLQWAERWGGTASGRMHLSTEGVGREALLKQLAGGGEVKLSKVEFRGWDVEASAEAGGATRGVSQWPSGAGEFSVGEQRMRFDAIELNGAHGKTRLSGTISFAMEGNLLFSPLPHALPGTHTISQARELRLSGPLENPMAAVQPLGASGKQP